MDSNSRSEVSNERAVLKCFAKYLEKHLCWSLFNKIDLYAEMGKGVSKFLFGGVMKALLY